MTENRQCNCGCPECDDQTRTVSACDHDGLHCHCGRPVFTHVDGFTRHLCIDCDANRCDTSDGMAAGCPHDLCGECGYDQYHAAFCSQREDHECEWTIRFRNQMIAAADLLALQDRVTTERVKHYEYLPAAVEFDCCGECNRRSGGYVPWPCAFATLSDRP